MAHECRAIRAGNRRAVDRSRARGHSLRAALADRKEAHRVVPGAGCRAARPLALGQFDVFPGGRAGDKGTSMNTVAFVSMLLFAQVNHAPAVGPAAGSLVIDGGGEAPPSRQKFVALAGGPDAEFVLIPTAHEDDAIDEQSEKETFRRHFGVKHVTVLHTRDRAEADTEAFVAPLKTARGVWFGGGRQWRLVDAYMGTRTQREIEAVLARGGVIGGSSAGATIQGSYLVRGAREGNQIMMAQGYEQGFGYLRGVAIDQHLLVRGRADDLVEVIDQETRAARPGT